MPRSHCLLRVLLFRFWLNVGPCGKGACFSRARIVAIVTREVVPDSCAPVILPLPSIKGIPGSLLCVLVAAGGVGALPGLAVLRLGVSNCRTVVGSGVFGEAGKSPLLSVSSIEVGEGFPAVDACSTSTKGKGLTLWKEKSVAPPTTGKIVSCGPLVMAFNTSLHTPVLVQPNWPIWAEAGWLLVNSLLANILMAFNFSPGAQVFFEEASSS